MLYLADLRAVERFGRPVTGIEWVWMHYGPYSATLVSIERDMVEAQAAGENGVVLDMAVGAPIPEVAGVLDRFRTVLAELPAEADEGEPSELVDELAHWAQSRADATRELFR